MIKILVNAAGKFDNDIGHMSMCMCNQIHENKKGKRIILPSTHLHFTSREQYCREIEILEITVISTCLFTEAMVIFTKILFGILISAKHNGKKKSCFLLLIIMMSQKEIILIQYMDSFSFKVHSSSFC